MVKESNHTRNDEEFQRALDNYSMPRGGVGLQATVIFPDGTVWSGASGYASHEKKCPLTLDHHLYIGSITKLYTAVLVMDQVENGMISLDDTLDKWLALPYAKEITVRMLLNHTSGIPNYTEDPWFLVRYVGLPRKQWQPDELVAVIRNKRLKFEPGSRHEYSNSNYLLLGVILEKVTGNRYGALLRGLAVDRLGLRDTYYFSRPSDLLIANGYDETLLHLGRRNLTGFRTSLETGAFSAGGVLSTSEDVASFTHSLFTGQILNDAILVQMKTFIEAPDKDVPLQKGYGLGVRNLIIGGENLIGHTGSIPGYSGIAMHNEEKHYTIVILSNLSVIEQTELLGEIQKVVLGNQTR
ncbi:MAG: serine hydrolase domain-containing protein [Anaerolineae bacterium]